MVTKLEQLKEWAKQNVTLIDLLPNNNNLQVTTRLIDVLEDEVDEKYYLSEEKTKKLTLDNDLGGKLNMYDYNERDKIHSVNKVSPTLNTMQGGDRQPKVAVLGNTSNTGHRSQNIHDIDGISPTIAARDYKGAKQIAVPVLTPDRVNKRQNGRRFKEDGEPMFTLTSQDRHGVIMGGDFDDKEIERDTFEILQALQKEIGEKEIAKWRSRILDTFQQEEILRQDVYEKGLDIEQDEKKFKRKEQSCECKVKNRTFDKQERVRKMPINKEFRCSSHGRGSIQQFARELTSIMQKLSHETSQEKNLYRLRETTQCIRLLQQALYKIQEVWGSSLHEKQTIRIRKLVPIETWRLQGFTDEQFHKAKDSGVSNSQLYKQAGNAISVPVVDAIVKCL